MFGKRDKTAPYEIMRPGSRESGDPPTSPRQSEGSQKSPGRGFSGSSGFSGVFGAGGKMGDWLTGGEPVVLRLAKGVAVLIAVGVIVLIVLAYWVGHARGGAAADAHYQAAVQASRRGIPFIPPNLENPAQTAPNLTSTTPASADPRTAGLNYLIIADYPYADAQRLRQFLAEREVETFLASSDNTQRSLVVGSAGFARRPDREAYEKRLRRLGREWRGYNGDRGDDLQSMWWKKHNPRK